MPSSLAVVLCVAAAVALAAIVWPMSQQPANELQEPLRVPRPTPLMIAAHIGEYDLASRLLQKALQTPSLMAQIGAQDAQRRTVIHYTLEGQHDKALDSLGGFGGNFSRLLELFLKLPANVLDQGYGCPVYDAVHLKNLAALRQLITYGQPAVVAACLTQLDVHGSMALHAAAVSRTSGMARIFRKLQQRGSRPSADFENYLGLDGVLATKFATEGNFSHAAMESSLRADDLWLVLEALSRTKLGKGRKGSAAIDSRTVLGDTVLMLAAWTGRRPEVLSGLLSRGADPRAKNVFGRTAAHLAATSGFEEQARLLLTHTPDLCNARDDQGLTPYDLAKRNRHVHLAATIATICDWEEEAEAPSDVESASSSTTTTTSDCDFDVVDGATLSTESFYRGYVTLSRPALITNLGLKDITWEYLDAHYGNVSVVVGDLPYPDLYGGSQSEKMTVADFLAAQKIATHQNGMYVFDAKVLLSETKLRQEIPPPTQLIGDRLILQQFMLGGANTGAAPHFHGSAVNMLSSGKKQWSLFPPPKAFFHFGAASAWWSSAEREAVEAAHDARRCIQRAGEVVFVPSQWGHAVLNLEPIVGVAYEFVPDTGRDADRKN